MYPIFSKTVVLELIAHAFNHLDAQLLRVDLRLLRYVTFAVSVLSSTYSAAFSPTACASSLQTSQHKWRVRHKPSWLLYRIALIRQAILAEMRLCNVNSLFAQDSLYALLIP